ncbi:hypothetical protein QZM93_38945, partial [Burkholderia cepacia]|uniref:hypothetical protein n=1 Tax=Burkholderia cepacia TaxID=292 RepID=UPI002653C2B4
MEEAIERFVGSSTGEALKCVLHAQKQIRTLLVTPVEQHETAPCDALEGTGNGADEWTAFDWLRTEISAVDCWYRGDPSYEHDAYWMKERALKLVADAEEIFRAPRTEVAAFEDVNESEGAGQKRLISETVLEMHSQIKRTNEWVHKGAIGYVELDELEKLGAPEFADVAESHVRLWHPANPPSRALIPVYIAPQPPSADAAAAPADEPSELEQVVACLGDDAATLRHSDEYVEMADNMEAAAR